MTSEARRDILRGVLGYFFAGKSVFKTVARPLKAIRGKPFVMNAVMNLQRGTGWEGLPQLAEVLLNTTDKDDLVLTNIEETYYFTRY